MPNCWSNLRDQTGRWQLAVLGAMVAVVLALSAGPAHADHVPSDIFAHFDESTAEALPGGSFFLEVHVGNNTGPPVDFTAPITVTVPTPAGATFLGVTGSLPLAVGGAPGGPPCATPPVGGTGPVVCTGALGASGSPEEETFIYVRFRADPNLVAGGAVTVEVSASVAGDPDPDDNSDMDDIEIGAGLTIVSAGPTDEISASPTLNCQAHHTGDDVNSFYSELEPIGRCGTALLVQSTGTSYGGDLRPLGDEVFTPVSQQLSGTGTAADPYMIVTVVDAGTSGLRLIQTDSYVVGQPQWRTDIEIVNNTETAQEVRLYRAADCYLGGSDSGIGQVGPQPGAVACRSETGRLLQWVPITPGSHYYEGRHSDVFDFVNDKLPFPDSCECGLLQDNGAGLSWDVTVPAFGSVTISHTTAILVTSVSKTADQPTSVAGQSNGYTITVTNYDSTPVSLSTISDELPAGFTYVPSSTTGATTTDPTIAAGTLTWNGPFTVPAGTAEASGVLSLHFSVTVPSTPGTYYNEATATSAGDTVEITPSGPTAPITVLAKASPTISTVASPATLVGAPVRDTATVAGGSGPTGDVTFRLFSDADCAVEVFTSTNPLSGTTATSDWFTPATAGTYRWTAVYNGDDNNFPATSPCNAPDESVTLAPFQAPTYTRIIRGDHLGPVTVTAGESVLIDVNARVVGPVTVQPGGALTIINASITRGVVADNPSFLSICGSSISGPTSGPSSGPTLAVSNAAVPIRIGDPATGCAGNRFAGQVTLTANLGVTFGANRVSHATAINNGGPGATVIKANTFFAALACSGNTPAPTNAGQPNTAASKTGQCTAV